MAIRSSGWNRLTAVWLETGGNQHEDLKASRTRPAVVSMPKISQAYALELHIFPAFLPKVVDA
jgi:hypothetical protein